MATLKILIGLPGVGKTTYCQKQMAEDDVRVSMDDIQKMLGGDTYNNYRGGLKLLYAQVERGIVLAALSGGHDVWLDRTNTDARRRKKYIGMARSVEAEVVVLNFMHEGIREAFSRERLLDRRMTNARNISREKWSEVLDRMEGEFNIPYIIEGLDEVISIDPKLLLGDK